MNKKDFYVGGIALIVVQFLINAGIFVKFADMTAYAVSKDSFSIVCEQIQDIQKDVKDIKVYLMNK